MIYFCKYLIGMGKEGESSRREALQQEFISERTSRGLSQNTFSRLTGVSRPIISRIEINPFERSEEWYEATIARIHALPDAPAPLTAEERDQWRQQEREARRRYRANVKTRTT